jgi:signal transduction histidine kinase
VEVLFESPGVGIELEPLYDERHGYLGAVGVIRSRSQSAVADTTVMVALAEALRSPMTCILGYSDLLANGQGLSQEQLDRYLQRIDANLARMSISLENLVTVLEMTDEPDMAPESVDVATALAAARDRCRSQFDEKSLVLELGAMEELPPVSADPAALGQILDNLLANAAQRSPQGGDVTATAEVREDVSGGRAVVIALADRGQAFTGVRGIIELDEASGANVSLTVVRMLAERQGGKAWAEAAEGRTRFLARLPVRRVVARPTTAATEAAREASAPPIQEPLPATT